MLGEVDLIEGCKDNDRNSQESLYKLFADKMLGVCLRYAKNKHEAEDFLQEGFIKVFHHIHQFKMNGSLEGWVRKIMVNTALEANRKRGLLYTYVEEEQKHQEVDTHSINNKYDTEYLLEIIKELPSGYKVIFNLYAIEGYAHKEIANMLNISEGTSKSQLSRARQLIQDKLKKNNLLDKHKILIHEQ